MPWTLSRVLVAVSAVLLAIGLVVATGNPSILLKPEAAPFTAVLVVILALAFVPRPWAQLAAGVLIGLFCLMALAFAASSLARPQAAPEFAVALILLFALVAGAPAGVRTFLAARRRTPEPGPREALRDRHGRIVAVLAVFLAGAIAASGLSWSYAAKEAGARGSYAIDPEATVPFAVTSSGFPKTPIAVPADKIVEMAIDNREPVFHTFTYTVGGEETSHDLLPGATTRFLVKFDEAGVVPVRCLPHSNSYTEGMVATLLVG